MSKVKNYYWDLAEKESDNIINNYVENKISKDAIKQLSNVEGIETFVVLMNTMLTKF